MDPKWFLYYLPSVIGGIMLVGGIYLLAKKKIYLDKTTKEVTDIELPFGLKVKTNVPALVYFAFGLALMIWPMLNAGSITVQKCVIRGQVHADTHPVQVYAVIKWDSLVQDGAFSFPVPRLFEAGECYKILYVCQNLVAEDLADLAGLQGNVLNLTQKQMQVEDGDPGGFEPKCDPTPAEFK